MARRKKTWRILLSDNISPHSEYWKRASEIAAERWYSEPGKVYIADDGTFYGDTESLKSKEYVFFIDGEKRTEMRK